MLVELLLLPLLLFSVASATPFTCAIPSTQPISEAISVPAADSGMPLVLSSPPGMVCTEPLGAAIYAILCHNATYLQTAPNDAEGQLVMRALVPPSAVDAGCPVQLYPVSVGGFLAEQAMQLGRLRRGNATGGQCAATDPTPLTVVRFASPTFIPVADDVWPARTSIYVLPFANSQLACDPLFHRDPPMAEAVPQSWWVGSTPRIVSIPLDPRLLVDHQESQIAIVLASQQPSTPTEDDAAVDKTLVSSRGLLLVVGALLITAAAAVAVYRIRAARQARLLSLEEEMREIAGYGTLL